MQMGYTIYDRVRTRIAEDNNWYCAYCYSQVTKTPYLNSSGLLATIDHKFPLSRGGSWKRYNLTCCCRECNEEKDDMTDQEYRLYRHMCGLNG